MSTVINLKKGFVDRPIHCSFSPPRPFYQLTEKCTYFERYQRRKTHHKHIDRESSRVKTKPGPFSSVPLNTADSTIENETRDNHKRCQPEKVTISHSESLVHNLLDNGRTSRKFTIVWSFQQKASSMSIFAKALWLTPTKKRICRKSHKA